MLWPLQSIAFSPCPNDVFLISAWIQGLVSDKVHNCFFADIESLNQRAEHSSDSLIKVSFAKAADLLDSHLILPIGSALSDKYGPKVVAKKPFSFESFSQLRLAIPGQNTTAHLLANHFLPQVANKLFCSYDQVIPLLNSSQADIGILIHESRFSLSRKSLYEIADLGVLWQEAFDLPLPLGGILARRDLGEEIIKRSIQALEESLLYAQKHPQKILPWLLEHSQEKDPDILFAHINLYVNKETQALSLKGMQAIRTLLSLRKKDLPEDIFFKY